MSRTHLPYAVRHIAALSVIALAVSSATLVGAQPIAAASPAPRNAEMSASAQAQSTDEPVAVPADTTAYSTTDALPDGTFESRFAATPQRVAQMGGWSDVDASLQPTADGSLVPAVTVNPLTLSGGGNGPLAVLHNDGASLALSWPTSLPTPQVDGDTATYANVLPNVDLQVTADTTGGVSELLVVRTVQAAQNPALTSLRLGTTTSGVTLHDDASDNISGVTTSGDEAFHSAEPMMWDSPDTGTTAISSQTGGRVAHTSTGLEPDVDPSPGDDTTTPSPDATVAAVDATVTSNAITLTPDQQMLDDPTTNYPVYIDPAFVNTTKSPSGWDWAQEAFPSSSHWESTSEGDPAVGYQGWTAGSYGRNRSYWQYDVSSVTGSNVQVESATLTSVEYDSGPYDCSASYTINATSVGHISSATTWNNQPGTGTFADSQKVSGASNANNCPNRTNTWDVTQSVRADGDGVATYRLSADDESDRNYYKRFGSDTTLTVSYDRAPDAPSAVTISPAPQNPSGSCTTNAGWIGRSATNITFGAHVSDPDTSTYQAVRADFHIWDKGGDGSAAAPDVILTTDAAGQSAYTGSVGGATVSKAVVATTFKNGHEYGLDAWGDDGHMNSVTSSSHCYFWYDNMAPTASATSTQFTDAGTSTLHVGQQGSFTLKAADAVQPGVSYSGINHFRYSFGSSADIAGDSGGTRSNATVSGANATATITYTPNVWGENYLYVAAYDGAGNQSALITYPFYVPDSPNFTPRPGDVTGDGIPDLLITDKASDTTNKTSTGQATAGALLVTSGDPTNGSQLSIASAPSDSPNATSWDGVLTTHRGSNTGTGIDDLYAAAGGTLYFYKNARNDSTWTAGQPYFPATKRRIIPPPICRSSATNCATYDPNGTGGDWSGVTQLVAPGDVDGDGYPDLIMVKNAELWFFHGTTDPGVLNDPRLLDNTRDWSVWRLTAPGDATGPDSVTDACSAGSATPGTANISVPDLWAAPTTADLGVTLFKISVAHHGCVDTTAATPHLDTINVGAPQTTGTDWYRAKRALFASPGDVNNDGIPDVYSVAVVSPNYQLLLNTGSTTTNTGAPLNAHLLVDNGHTIDWSQFSAMS